MMMYQRSRGFTTMRYINRLFTCFITYVHKHTRKRTLLKQPTFPCCCTVSNDLQNAGTLVIGAQKVRA